MCVWGWYQGLKQKGKQFYKASIKYIVNQHKGFDAHAETIRVEDVFSL